MDTNDPTNSAQNTFESAWPGISGHLTRILRREGVADDVAEDVIQETAYRLWSRWAALDPSSSMLPLAVTIARNLVIDHHRRSVRIDLGETSYEDVAPNDVEREVLAKIRLGAVHKLLRQMNPRYSKLLLAEAGYLSEEGSGGSTRTARTRARQRLRDLVEQSPNGAWIFVAPLTGLGKRCRRALGRPTRGNWTVTAPAATGMTIVVASLLFTGTAGGIAEGAQRPKASGQQRVPASEGHRKGPADREAARSLKKAEGGVAYERRSLDRGSEVQAGSLLIFDEPLSKGRSRSSGGFGIRGVDESGEGSGSVAGEDLTWDYTVNYRNPECVRRAARGKPTTNCEMTPDADAGGSVGHGDSQVSFDAPP